MRINVIFIQPPFPANERHKKVMPLGLAYLAAYLRHALPEVSTTIIDAQAEDLSLGAILERIGMRYEKEALLIVGVTLWTLQAPFAHELSSRIKQGWPDAIVVYGGIHASVLPEESLQFADYCVMREGEVTFTELISALGSGRGAAGVKGCAWRDGGRTVLNPPRDFIEDLDSVPFPAWDKLDMHLYDTPLHIVGGPRVPVIGSRGCPYNCIYCGSPFMWRRKLRWRTAANVLAEMEEIIRRYHIRQFHFWDDNLMLSRDYIEGLCEGIVGRGLSIRWTGLTRPSHVIENADLMPLLKRAGCIGLEIGIESANPRTFAEIGKHEDLDQIAKVAELHKRHDMYPMFTYMAFNPGETIYGYWLQARFIDRILEGLPVAEHFQPTKFPIYIGQFCTAHPGTGLYSDASHRGIVLADGWGDYYHHQINFIPDSLLDDVPLQLKRRLDGVGCALLNYLIQVAFWSDFNRSRPEREQREELRRFERYTGAFYRMCRGRLSVRQIALRLTRKLRITERESLRFAAFLSYVLAQMGLIRSARDEESAVMRERHIAAREEIPRLLAPAENRRWHERLLGLVRRCGGFTPARER